jgi:hypothetical protein
MARAAGGSDAIGRACHSQAAQIPFGTTASFLRIGGDNVTTDEALADGLIAAALRTLASARSSSMYIDGVKRAGIRRD